MDAIWTKVLATGLIVLFSAIFGFLPLIFQKKFASLSPSHSTYNKKKKKNVILSILLNFGGGVLIANCFCHWLPEVREGIEKKDLETELPVAELVMCAGFFTICLVEECLHHCLHPHKETGAPKKVRPVLSSKDDAVTSFRSTEPEVVGMEKEEDEEEVSESSSDKSKAARTKSAIRTFFVVSALSFHSTIEGLALGIEDSDAGIWMNFGATAMHKFVIAFSVGVELVSAQTSKLNYYISTLVFAFAPALGVGIALIIGHFQAGSEEFDDFPLQILQGLATGTVVYVVFFEIFPKGSEIGGTGFQHVMAMTLGFATFFPSLFFHVHDDHDGHGNGTSHEH